MTIEGIMIETLRQLEDEGYQFAMTVEGDSFVFLDCTAHDDDGFLEELVGMKECCGDPENCHNECPQNDLTDDEFQVGDIVKILETKIKMYEGKVGVITDIDFQDFGSWPFHVQFKNPQGDCFFSQDELVLVYSKEDQVEDGYINDEG